MKRLLLLLTAVLLLCCGCQKARGDVDAVSCNAEAPSAASSAGDTTTVPDKATIPYSATQTPTGTSTPRVVPSGETTRKNLDGENTSAADVQQTTQDFSPPQNWKPPHGDPRNSTPDSTTTATAYTHNDDPEESVEFWFPALRDARYCEDIILWDAYYHMVQYPKFCNHTVTDFEEKHIPSNEPGIETIQVTLRTEVGDYTVSFTQNGEFIKDNQ